MSYAVLEKQIRSLPEECLPEVSDYIEFVLFRYEQRKQKDRKGNAGRYFGSIKTLPDGMELQRRLRDEWD